MPEKTKKLSLKVMIWGTLSLMLGAIAGAIALVVLRVVGLNPPLLGLVAILVAGVIAYRIYNKTV